MNEEINEELIKQEMQKPLGAALTAVEWFVFLGFVDYALKQDNLLASPADVEAISKTAKRLHDQIFPAPKTEAELLEEKLKLKPKKIITKPDIIL